MHAILIPIGSSGDVHPFLGIGRALHARGHDVTVLTNEHFQGLTERCGLRFSSLGSDEMFRSVLANPDLWHPLKAFPTVMAMVTAGLDDLYQRLRELIAQAPGQTILVAPTLAFAARILQDELGVPLVSVHLQPAILRSLNDPPLLPPLPVRPGRPRWWNSAWYYLADRLVIDRVVGKPINNFRKAHGLPPVRRVFHQWIHSPLLTLGLFPDWFGPQSADFPLNLHCVGFPLYDESGATVMPAAALEFLDAGDKPIVFTPGSANLHGQDFFAAAVEACRIMERRGILLTRFPEQLPAKLPANVRHFSFIPFSQVLPRAAAVVHHGGIGSCAQGLAAGVPQLIMPLAHDQPDNAARLIKLGVGASLPPSRFRGPAVARELWSLLNTPAVAVAAKACAERIAGQNAIKDACDVIEEVARKRVAKR